MPQPLYRPATCRAPPSLTRLSSPAAVPLGSSSRKPPRSAETLTELISMSRARRRLPQGSSSPLPTATRSPF
ncbi:hypothetical protein BD413DRAFT_544660 [Trametes elegans]|nr:hypothetical protein BD413DRAFT_544660 [Trametes elegans]